MLTWEMIKELTEHPEKRFVHKNGKAIFDRECCSPDYCMKAKIENSPTSDNKMIIILSDEWTEVIEPVDFLTAKKDVKQNCTRYKGVSVNGYHLNQLMYMCDEGVYIKNLDGGSQIYLDCMWIKQ